MPSHSNYSRKNNDRGIAYEESGLSRIYIAQCELRDGSLVPFVVCAFDEAWEAVIVCRNANPNVARVVGVIALRDIVDNIMDAIEKNNQERKESNGRTRSQPGSNHPIDSD